MYILKCNEKTLAKRLSVFQYFIQIANKLCYNYSQKSKASKQPFQIFHYFPPWANLFSLKHFVRYKYENVVQYIIQYTGCFYFHCYMYFPKCFTIRICNFLKKIQENLKGVVKFHVSYKSHNFLHAQSNIFINTMFAKRCKIKSFLVTTTRRNKLYIHHLNIDFNSK